MEQKACAEHRWRAKPDGRLTRRVNADREDGNPVQRLAGLVAVIVAMLIGIPALGQSQGVRTATQPTQRTQSIQPAPGTTSNDPTLEHRPRYRVAPGDVLGLEFPFTPAMNQTVTIEPDGYVTLRAVGDFYAEGKTTDQLSADLKKAYGQILYQPVINVNLVNFQEPYFIVGGQVAHPGKFSLREDTSVVEALAIAGGLTASSKHSQVLLFRRFRPGQVQVIQLNVKKMLHSHNLTEDVYLEPGDMLYVPKNFISKIAPFLPSTALSTYFGGPVKF